LRHEFYRWRQTGPAQRFFAAVLFLAIWLPRMVVHRLQRLFSPGRSVQRALVIHLAGLGDMLMLTPALAALHDRYSGAKIDLITLHPYVKEAFDGHSRLNKIATLPAYPGQWIIARFGNRTGGRLWFATIRFYPELLLKLAFNGYDVGISFGLSDFDQAVGNSLLCWLDIPTRLGVRGANDRLLTEAAHIDFRKTHRVDAYLNFLKPLGIATANRKYEYITREADSQTVQQLLRNQNVDSTRPLAVIHPGGKLHINSRRWPAEYFARVCSFLSHEGFEILVTGDGDDAAVCNEVARACGNSAKSVAAQLNFSQTAALLKHCDLVITNDTATLHLAEAMNVRRVVSIFGPTDPVLLVPQNERHLVFRSNLPCAPCMGGIIDSTTERCPRDVKEECLLQTTPEQVVSVLKEFYTKPAARLASL
jgi:ADP-heptose:LPS heptosyltransferase